MVNLIIFAPEVHSHSTRIYLTFCIRKVGNRVENVNFLNLQNQGEVLGMNRYLFPQSFPETVHGIVESTLSCRWDAGTRFHL